MLCYDSKRMMTKMIKDEIILLNDCWPYQPLLGNGLHSPASHHHTPVHQVLLTTMMVVMMMMVMTITMSTVEKFYNLWKCCAGQLPGHSLPVPELHKWRGQSDSERQMIILMLLYYNIATDGFFILLIRIRRLNISCFPVILVMKMMMMMMMKMCKAIRSTVSWVTHPLGPFWSKGSWRPFSTRQSCKKTGIFCRQRQIEFANIANPCVYRYNKYPIANTS